MYEENGEQGGRPSGATCVSGVGWPELASGRGVGGLTSAGDKTG